jgi:hypothetical protein
LFGSKGIASREKIHTALNGKAIIFFDSNGILLQNGVPLKQAVNSECYANTALWNAIWGE